MSKNHLLYSVSEMEMVYQQQIQPARRAQLSSSGGVRDDAACASGTRSPSSDTAESPLVRISINAQPHAAAGIGAVGAVADGDHTAAVRRHQRDRCVQLPPGRKGLWARLRGTV